MTLLEMKKKVLALIEELNPDHPLLTDDPDIATKLIEVINQVMFELARFKKIPKYISFEVEEGDKLTLAKLEGKSGGEVYQIASIGGVKYELRANGTVIKVLESGIIEIDCFIYPERITETTKDNYEFELSSDVLEIMPYGIAGDLLKSDVSTEYGRIYSDRYESLKSMLDPRYTTASIYFEGGITL